MHTSCVTSCVVHMVSKRWPAGLLPNRLFERTNGHTTHPTSPHRRTYHIALRQLHQGREDGKYEPASKSQGGQAPALPPPLLLLHAGFSFPLPSLLADRAAQRCGCCCLDAADGLRSVAPVCVRGQGGLSGGVFSQSEALVKEVEKIRRWAGGRAPPI